MPPQNVDKPILSRFGYRAPHQDLQLFAVFSVGLNLSRYPQYLAGPANGCLSTKDKFSSFLE